MAQYLIAVHHPDGYDPPAGVDDAIHRDVAALNNEMKAAAVSSFVGGLQSPDGATWLAPRPDGRISVIDGPFVETKEHLGGFWILKVDDLDEALAWGRKAAAACRAQVEVRAFRWTMDPVVDATRPG